MIVDDEYIVRKGIKFIIDNSFDEEVKIIAMAKTGREAIKLFEEKRPQIILMDIQMPGINGMDAIRRIKKVDEHVRMIIISAYEQFDYAKEAVALDVENYILKPINKKKLVETLHTTIEEINKERQSREKEIEVQEKLDQLLPVVEHGYIYSIIMNMDYQEVNKHYTTLLEIEKSYAYMMVIELEDQAFYHKVEMESQRDYNYGAIRHIIKYKCPSVVGPIMINRISVMVYIDSPKDEYQQRVKAIELAEIICERISNRTKTQVHIGIGGYNKIQEVNVSYNEAIKALGKITDEQVLHIADVVMNNKKSYMFMQIKREEAAIAQAVTAGAEEEVEERMHLLFLKLQEHYMEDRAFMDSIAIELMVLVYVAGFQAEAVEETESTMTNIEAIKKQKTFYALRNYCITEAKKVACIIKAEKRDKVSVVIKEAIEYIQKHYNQDIHLKEVAEAVAISPQYFSKIFKKEMGINFIDYLTDCRMNVAKKMLKEKKLSIKEICFMIGYKDPNYFSRLFKKVEGISPTNYE